MLLRHEGCFTRPERYFAFDNIIWLIFIQIYDTLKQKRYMQIRMGIFFRHIPNLRQSSILTCILHVAQYIRYISTRIMEKTPFCSMTWGCLSMY